MSALRGEGGGGGSVKSGQLRTGGGGQANVDARSEKKSLNILLLLLGNTFYPI